MNNYDLVSAYFDGELNANEQTQLLNKLDTDLELKREFELHTDIVEGIKNARKAELKAMLDNVTIPSGTGAEGLSLGKAAIIGGVIVAAGVAYYMSASTPAHQTVNEQLAPKEIIEPVDQLLPDPIVASDQSEATKAVTTPSADNTTDNTDQPVVSANQQPVTPEISKPVTSMPTDLLADEEELDIPESSMSPTESTASSLEIEIDNGNKKHQFHYSFESGKLFLFGNFDRELYEILEFNTENGKTYYLYYQSAYYHLDPQQTRATELEKVQDTGLIESLQTARQ